MKPTPGLCDRCGQRYKLSALKYEYVLGKSTGLRTCPSCYDESHPQLDTRNVKTSDKQSVDDPRSDNREWTEERKVCAWNPVGAPLTGTLTISVGRLTTGADT